MKSRKAGTVRIIGGDWRGTRLPVPDLPGLRPSGDRGRETLFNWLQMHVRGARCADLFAGSGALGLEAASRGAASVVLIEKSARAAAVLRETVRRLRADHVTVLETDACAWLADCEARSLDIVFIDPPFGTGLETRALDLLARGDCLAPGALVYMETDRESPPAEGFEVSKEKALGEVRMQLLKKIDPV